MLSSRLSDGPQVVQMGWREEMGNQGRGMVRSQWDLYYPRGSGALVLPEHSHKFCPTLRQDLACEPSKVR